MPIDKNKYTSLLLNLIILFLLIPLSAYLKNTEFLFSLSFTLMIIFAIKTLNLSKQILNLFYILAGLSLITDLINIYDTSQISQLLTNVTNIFDAIFLIFSIMTIYRKINLETNVNNDVIRGSICIYLMLGILWYLFYQIIYVFDINAFRFPEFRSASENINLFYFSFTTLTTVGYGDITPMNNYAMIISNLEGLCGQLFPAIAIGTLVSLYKK